MLLCLLGVVIYLCGLPIVRLIWVPWLYLFFAVPLPKSIYFSLTDPPASDCGGGRDRGTESGAIARY